MINFWQDRAVPLISHEQAIDHYGRLICLLNWSNVSSRLNLGIGHRPVSIAWENRPADTVSHWHDFGQKMTIEADQL